MSGSGSPRQSTAEVTDKGTAQLQQRPQNFGDASTMRQSPRTAAYVEQSQAEPRKQVTCAGNGRAREDGCKGSGFVT